MDYVDLVRLRSGMGTHAWDHLHNASVDEKSFEINNKNDNTISIRNGIPLQLSSLWLSSMLRLFVTQAVKRIHLLLIVLFGRVQQHSIIDFALLKLIR